MRNAKDVRTEGIFQGWNFPFFYQIPQHFDIMEPGINIKNSILCILCLAWNSLLKNRVELRQNMEYVFEEYQGIN